MKFEWDRHKAILNLRKHGVSFEEAATALLDGLSTTASDPDHSSGETRLITFGLSARRRLLAVSNTPRGEFVRIISARPATKQEREIYGSAPLGATQLTEHYQIYEEH
jgi:uncharacterized DUF497 family protein